MRNPSNRLLAGFIGLALLSSAGACTGGLDVESRAFIACSSDSECPEGFQCEETRGSCFRTRDGATPPTVQLEAIPRSAGVVEFAVRVFDPDGDDVTFNPKVSVGGGDFSAIEVEPMGATGSQAGERVTLRWDPASAFGAGAVLNDVVIRLEPEARDGFGPAVESEAFSVGNEAPVIETFEVPTSQGRAGGSIPLRLRVRDSSGDLVTLTRLVVQSVDGDELAVSTADTSHFPDPASLSWVADGVEHSIVWNSDLAGDFVDENVVLVAELEDELGASALEAVSAPFVLNNAPVVTLSPLNPSPGQRFVDNLQLDGALSDPAGAGESLTALLEFSTDGTTWSVATLTGDNPVVGISGSGQSLSLLWDVLADATLSTGGLALSATGQVSFVAAAQLRLTVSDSTGAERVVLVGPFDLGNDPPVVTPEGAPNLARGDVALGLFLQDTAADPVDLEAEFSLADGVWRRAAVATGSVNNVPTATADPGASAVFVWDSRAPADVDPAVAQGVGQVSVDGVRVRIRACDSPGAPATACGAWQTLDLGGVQNQTAAIVNNVRVLRPRTEAGSGPFAVTFDLFDAENDRIDVRFEVSIDGGQNWAELPEYPIPASEGFYDLVPGPEHVVYVDPSLVAIKAIAGAQVRVSATDGYPAGAPLVTRATGTISSPLEPLGGSGTSEEFFAPVDDYPFAGMNPESTWIGNFVGDGAGDVLVFQVGFVPPSSPPDGGANVYEGSVNGDGVLTASGSIAPGGLAQTIAKFDIDFDGFDDIIVNHGESGFRAADPQRLVVHYGGASAMSSAFVVGSGIDFDALLVADLDENGRGDIVAVQEFPEPLLYVYLAGAPGTARASLYGAPTIYPFSDFTSLGFNLVRDVAVGDIDGNGTPDIVMSDANAQLIFALTDGAGAVSSFATHPVGLEPYELIVAAIDGDERDDVVVNERNSGQLRVLYSSLRADGEFFGTAQTLPLASIQIGNLLAEDLNGDGAPDLVALDSISGDLFFASGLRGELGASTLFSGLVLASEVAVLAGTSVADLNDDGRLDIAGLSGSSLRVYRSQAGSFASSRFGSSLVVSVDDSRLYSDLADVNGDGSNDVIVSSFGSKTVELLYRGATAGAEDGSKTPLRQTYVPEGMIRSPISAAAADFDRNGVGDLVVGGDLELIVAMGEAGVDGPNFPTQQTFSFLQKTGCGNTPSAWDVETGDVDGDGWEDIVVAVNDPSACNPTGLGTVAVLYNQGTYDKTTTFTSVSEFVAGTYPYTVELDDIDFDGNVDLVVADNFGGAQIVILRGDGARGFETPIEVATSDNTRDATACDLNGDGFIDLAAVPDDPWINVFQGDTVAPGATPSFTQRSNVTLPARGESVDCVDVNADGFDDLIVSSSGIQIFLGQASLSSPLISIPFNAVSSFGSRAHVEVSGPAARPSILTTGSGEVAQWFVGQDPGTGVRESLDSVSTPDLHLNGIGLPRPGLDRFGRPYVTMLTYHRSARPSFKTPPPEDPCGGGAPSSWIPVSDEWRVFGDTRLARVFDDSGTRLRATPRFGEENVGGRSGLNLSITPASGQRGVRVTLPLFSGAGASVADLRVVIESPDFLRAPEHPDDAFFGDASATAFLPKPNGTLLQPVEQPVSFDACPDSDGDLATGTGRRFTVAGDELELLTDELGTIRVYKVAP